MTGGGTNIGRVVSVPAVGAPRDAIIAWLDELLAPSGFADLGPNGLQVPGAETVTTVVTGVSGQAALFERAVELGAELVLVHHRILWDFHPRRIDARQARRLRLLLANDVSLAAYHLPLDAHRTVGNNGLLASGLGCLEEGRRPCGAFKGKSVGIAASVPGAGIPPDELVSRVERLCGQTPL